ncbi:hypothetical protein D3C75_625470 [compost metagenome]
MYKVKQPASFPVNLTGTWATDQLLLVDVTDSSLRTDLATQGAAIIFGAAQTVTSIAALRLLLKTSISTYASVLGYYAVGDGGGGRYWLDTSDNTSADDGCVTIVASDGGRWKLVVTQPIDLRQWGCKGDGVTDDTTRYMAAVNYGKPFHIPSGNFMVAPVGPDAVYPGGVEPKRTSGAVLVSNQNITGEGASSILTWNGPGIPQAFFMVRDAKDVTISDVQFVGGYSALIVDPLTNGSVENVGLQNCILDGQLIGLLGGRQYALDPTGSKYCVNVWARGCKFKNTTYHAVLHTNSYASKTIGNDFRNIGNFCVDHSQGTHGAICANNTGDSVFYFTKVESSNVAGGTDAFLISQQVSIYGNNITNITQYAVFLNSYTDKILIANNQFQGSTNIGIFIDSVTGLANEGQCSIVGNVIRTAVSGTGILSQLDASTYPLLIEGNNIIAGESAIDLRVSQARIIGNTLIATTGNAITTGLGISPALKNLVIDGNELRGASGIVSQNTLIWTRVKVTNNTFFVTNFAVYAALQGGIKASKFNDNTVNYAASTSNGAMSLSNLQGSSVKDNVFNMVAGSGQCVTTINPTLKSIISGNISTVGFTLAGPDASTTANAVNNIIDATYAP